MTALAGERRGAGRPRALSTENVVDAGLELIARQGLAALSIRTLASHLNVTPRTVYTYVESKDQLLSLMADRFLEQAGVQNPRPDHQWLEEIRRISREYYRLYVEHPYALELLLSADASSTRSRDVVEANITLLERAGFSRDDSLMTNRALNRFILGSAHGELTDAAQRTTLRAQGATDSELIGLDGDAIFEHGLALILEAIGRRQ